MRWQTLAPQTYQFYYCICIFLFFILLSAISKNLLFVLQFLPVSTPWLLYPSVSELSCCFLLLISLSHWNLRVVVRGRGRTADRGHSSWAYRRHEDCSEYLLHHTPYSVFWRQGRMKGCPLVWPSAAHPMTIWNCFLYLEYWGTGSKKGDESTHSSANSLQFSPVSSM